MDISSVKKVTVVGMGTMGPDIALGFALGGVTVTGIDINPKMLEQASKKIDANCRQMVEWGLLDKGAVAGVRSRISMNQDWDGSVREADYIMEAVPELLEVKQQVIGRIAEVCRDDVVIASNTSTMDITEMARAVKGPERVIGTHWFIPAHLMPPVEVIPGDKTSESTVSLAFDLLRKVGKLPVHCKNRPGFIHNYVQYAMVGAAVALVENGIATAEEVDTVVENGFALRLSSTGPFKSMDMTGLDAVINVFKYLYSKTGEAIYKPSKLLEEKVRLGELGHKTGKGFFSYSKEAAESSRTMTNRSVAAVKKALGKR